MCPCVAAAHLPPQLTTLKLGWCKVAGGDGARALSDLLLLNASLTHLDLRGNSLGNDGAILLSRGLKVRARVCGCRRAANSAGRMELVADDCG